MSVVHLRKNSNSGLGQWFGEINDDDSINSLQSFSEKTSSCSTCCGFYGPCFDQPLCHTCHAFLVPENSEEVDGSYVFQEKTDSEDSGNEEPLDFYETIRHRRRTRPRVTRKRPRLDKLSECITALSCPQRREVVVDNIVEGLPTEVLTAIFSYLDDLTLWNCSQVCRQWASVVKAGFSNEKWWQYVKKRWPLFKPSFGVPCWQTVYRLLTQSASCMMCLHQMTTQVVKSDTSDEKWRAVRIKNEEKSLRADPPEGIEAVPLDKSFSHWQASITGPNDSPYEGGTFFLHLQIPHNYPMKPPVVRFITKIFHPNISRHGNIGIDSIQENWSLALTISKILISIQSLLTDPYCHVCMEPDIGRLYCEERAIFDATARYWTLKYAMVHRRSPFSEQAFTPSSENR